jgi:hypothetical protein
MNVQEQIKKEYLSFFTDEAIIPCTGIKEGTNKRFATYPFIGSEFGKTKKILFVGLDIGKDENYKNNAIISFKSRKIKIEDENRDNHNTHIRGTFVTAGYLIDQITFDKQETYKTSIKNTDNLKKNYLKFVSLTNYYKFVNVKRKNRLGSFNRKDPKLAQDLLKKEINILNPDIIVFQSKSFSTNKTLNDFVKSLNNKNMTIYLSNHPSDTYGLRQNTTKLINTLIKVKTTN